MLLGRGDAIIAAATPIAASARPRPRVTPSATRLDIAVNGLAAIPPLYLVTGAMLAGDALGGFRAYIPLWIAVLLAAAAAGLYLAARRQQGLIVALFAIFAAANVPVRHLFVPPRGPATLYRYADGARITVEGRLERAPEAEEGGRLYLFVGGDRAGIEGSALTPVSGTLRLTVIGGHFRIGDRIRASGRLRFPRNDGNPREFDYVAFLRRQGVVATIFVGAPAEGAGAAITIVGHHEVFPASLIETIRDRIGAFIDANLPDPERAEMRALIIGDRGGISEALRQRFALTGMAHLLVISGLHLGIVAAVTFFSVRLLMSLLATLTALGYANKVAAIGAALAVAAYAAIAGHHVSTLRALLMVLAYALAIVLDRSREVLSSLALAALAICLLLPGSTADIAFQLSFASVLVILLGMRRFRAWWRWRFENPLIPGGRRPRANRVAEWLVGYVAVSGWALVGTAPLTAFHFNQFALVGLVANAVVVPIIGFGAVICGLVAAGLSFVYLPIARELLHFAGDLAGLGTWLAGWFERWPYAWTRVFTPTLLELALIYGLIALWLTRPLAGTVTSVAGPPRRRLTMRRGALITLILALTLDAGWWAYQRYLNPDLRVTFLAVGEGDGAVIRFPGGRVMLIDGGGAFRGTFDPGERIVAPYLWSQKIMHVNYIAVSHPDRDHFGGLIFIANNFTPSEFWTTGVTKADASYGDLLAAVARAGARTRRCDSATPTVAIGGVTVQCLWPPPHPTEAKDNNESMVIRLAYRGRAILFTGDLEAHGEHELIATGAPLRAAILKVPHHGSITSSSPELISAVAPSVAVISLGYLNQFHFPSPAVVARYRAMGVRVLRTDTDGSLLVDLGPSGIQLRTPAAALPMGLGRRASGSVGRASGAAGGGGND